MEEQGYEYNNETRGEEQYTMESRNSREPLGGKRGTWNISEEDLPEEFKVVPTLHFFLYQLIFTIPIVGLVVIFILSFGAGKNKNIRNFARAQLLAILVGIVLTMMFSTLLIGLFATFVVPYLERGPVV